MSENVINTPEKKEENESWIMVMLLMLFPILVRLFVLWVILFGTRSFWLRGLAAFLYIFL
jgi:hypothetical protein